MRSSHLISETLPAGIGAPQESTTDVVLMVALLGAVLLAATLGFLIGRSDRGTRKPDEVGHQEDLLHLADTPNLGFARFDSNLKAIGWNHGMERLLAELTAANGASSSASEPRPDWWTAIHPDDRPRLRTTLRGLQPNQSTSCDFRVHRTRDRWWSMRGTIHRRLDGTSSLLFHDDSQRAHVERRIESATRLRRTLEIAIETLESADDLEQTMCELLTLIGEELDLQRIGWFQVETDHRCRGIACWSPPGSETTGITLPATLAGARLERLRSGRPVHERDDQIDRFTHPIRIDDHLDSLLVAEFAPDVDSADELTLVFGRFCDTVGRRFERQEAARRSDAFAAVRGSLERSEILLQLAGGLRHDFNNVAFAIGGRISLLLQRTDDPLFVEGLGEIGRAVDAASILIDRFAPAEGGDHRQVEIPLRAELEAITNTVKRLLPRRLRVDLECADSEIDDGVMIKADPEALQRMILHLAVNSRDAIEGRGRIRISAIRLDRDRVEIRVDDDGPGIPPPDRDRYLQPFESGPASTGAGIGLSLCRRLTDRMGGRLSLVDGSLGGLGVHVSLPVLEGIPCRLAESAASAGETPRMPGTALVVEDNEVVREVIVAHLEQAGTKAIPAPHALDVETMLESDPRIEMLVMDIDLPGRSGIDVITALRARGNRTPCVLITGGAQDPPALDRTTLLRKPFGMEPLVETIRALLADAEPGPSTGRRVG